MSKTPLMAILRGLLPSRAAQTASMLASAGFNVIEVPLNRDGALEAIKIVRRAVGDDVIVGAGTVLTAEDARAAHAAGAELLVAPNLNAAMMEEGRVLGCGLMPGVMTPTEAFAALSMGAHALKLFPGEVIRPRGLRALRAVLPDSAKVYPVGGVSAENLAEWYDAGADGFGIGSALFRPEFSDDEIGMTALSLREAWEAIRSGS
jgi:2-dehydro-3-deoxyphosphogalactonate aldolase